MKKYLSILFIAIFAAFFVFSTTSCSKDDASNDYAIVRTWKLEEADALFGEVETAADEIYIQYQKDGSYVVIAIVGNDVGVSRGTWTLYDNTLTTSETVFVNDYDTSVPAVFTITSLTKDQLSLLWLGLVSFKFKRVPDSEIEKYL